MFVTATLTVLLRQSSDSRRLRASFVDLCLDPSWLVLAGEFDFESSVSILYLNSLVLTPEVTANTVRAYIENLVGCIPHLIFTL
jgi:hypothetical protein